MRKLIPFMLTLAMVAFPLLTVAQKTMPKDEPNSLVITFKDGRQKTFLMADITRVEVNTGKAQVVSKTRFLGKWKVGEGNGGSFYITLEQDGIARKSIGSSHGSWTVIDNEARITWDDGWHDAIRKNGARFEKAAFGPGKTFTDAPDNVTKAENTEAQPL